MRAPNLSWDATLKTAKIGLGLMPDYEMHKFFEKSTRGWISYIYNRYIKPNIKYLKSYDQKQKSKQTIYLGANNLYDCAISKFLPISGFEWIDPKAFDLNKYTINSSK